MEFIRILSLRFFDPEKRRFSNVGFKQPSGAGLDTPDGKKGISVFERPCAAATGRTPCEHIRHFYSGHFPEPCAYWSFDSHLLTPPPGQPDIQVPIFVHSPLPGGDPCHYNIHHLSSSRAQKIFDAQALSGQLTLCTASGPQSFDADTATALKREFFADPS